MLGRTFLRIKTCITKTHAAKVHKRTIQTTTALCEDDLPIEMENPFQERTNRCTLCGVPVDYKNVQLLSQFVSSVTGLPFPQKATNLCDHKYKEVIHGIRVSRASGYMPYTYKEAIFLDDPVLAFKFEDKLDTFSGDDTACDIKVQTP